MAMESTEFMIGVLAVIVHRSEASGEKYLQINEGNWKEKESIMKISK